MTKTESKFYTELGVSAAKADVEAAASVITRDLFPRSFCRVMPDIFNGDPDYCVLSHADGAGTKSLLAYLHYQLHGNPTVFQGIAQDALVMNIDDLICSGAVSNFVVTSVINRNAIRIGADVLEAVIGGTQEFIKKMRSYGITMTFCGGETADVGDIVRSILVDATLTTRLKRQYIIENSLQPHHLIVGLSSGGSPANYETLWNSGIGSNGITLARHLLLSPEIRDKFPEIADDVINPSSQYRGRFAPDDMLPGIPLTVLESLLSPTRTFAPVMMRVFKTLRNDISGIVHCTGGGQVKCLKFANGVKITKKLSSPFLPIFEEIKKNSNLSWIEMAKVFNLGYRLEVYISENAAFSLIETAKSLGVHADVIGRVKPYEQNKGELELNINNECATFTQQ